MKKKTDRKMYQAIMFERQVTLMFNQIAKKSGKNKSEFLLELLEMWRTDDTMSAAEIAYYNNNA